jgi:hypothetical protein
MTKVDHCNVGRAANVLLKCASSTVYIQTSAHKVVARSSPRHQEPVPVCFISCSVPPQNYTLVKAVIEHTSRRQGLVATLFIPQPAVISLLLFHLVIELRQGIHSGSSTTHRLNAFQESDSCLFCYIVGKSILSRHEYNADQGTSPIRMPSKFNRTRSHCDVPNRLAIV